MSEEKKATKEKKTNNLNIYQKIVEVRRSIQHLSKDAASHHHKYISGDNLLSAIRPKMDELNIILLTKVIDHKRDGMIVDLTIEYHFVNADHPEDCFIIPWYATGRQNDPSQSFGAAMTYSERYVLKKTFLVPTDEDDPDAKTPSNSDDKKPVQQQSHSQPSKSSSNGKTKSPSPKQSQSPSPPNGKTESQYRNEIAIMPAYLAYQSFPDGSIEYLNYTAKEIYTKAGAFQMKNKDTDELMYDKKDNPIMKEPPIDLQKLSLGWAKKIHHVLKDKILAQNLTLDDALTWWDALGSKASQYNWWKVETVQSSF